MTNAPRVFAHFQLDDFQVRAIEAIERGESVLVAAPTGAGKTVIAEYAIEQALIAGRKAIYTAPIKALNNQKFRDFGAAYPDKVGIKTGDVTINPDAPVLLMTTEIFRNTLFESEDPFRDVQAAIFDEIHYLDDIERGTVWEESLIFAPEHIQVVALSATVPNVDELVEWIGRIRERPVRVIREDRRPVPLEQRIFVPGVGPTTLADLFRRQRRAEWPAWVHEETRRRGRRGGEPRPRFPEARRRELDSRADLILHLQTEEKLPALYFVFNRRDCREFAHRVRHPLVSNAEREGLLGEFDRLTGAFGVAEDPAAREMRELLARGVAFHHAGLLPTLKEVIERLFTTGRVKLLFATETFAVGVNMPARTVVFSTIERFDGTRNTLLKAREHSQMSGRAGRRGIDPVGFVYTVAPWPRISAEEIEQVIEGRIEPIRSQFNLAYSSVLSLYDRVGERIFALCEKSFANVAAVRGSGSQKFFQRRVKMVKKRLMILRAFGYLEGERLTEKGRFASQIHGYELPAAELFYRGILKHLSEPDLCAVFVALVYEAKRADWHAKADAPSLRGVEKAARRAVEDVIRSEQSLGLEEVTKPADFRIAAAAWRWAEGCSFEELGEATSAAAGDLVRTFRMAIQLLRQTAAAVPHGDPLARRLWNCLRRLNRDEIDAERQLRLGVEIE